MNLKRLGLMVVAAAVAVSMAACSSSASGSGTGSGTGGGTGSGSGSGSGSKSIANIVPGALGDQSFFDSAESGIQTLKAAGYTTTTLQADTTNIAQWKSNLQSVSTGQWGLVVIGSSVAVDPLTELAPKFPNQHYIFYDGEVKAPNVASITYKQNESGYLSGVLAALVSGDPKSFPLAAGKKTIGVIGAMDIPVIQDTIVGFQAGAKAVDPNVKVLTSTVGSWTDSAKAYDQAKAMFDQGADVVFGVASAAGAGILQAAKDANKYAIGIDSNQNAVQRGHILASALKKVGESIDQAAKANEQGKLEYGKTTVFGLANDGVGLTYDDNGGIVPDSVVKAVDDYKKKVVAGDIKVPTVLA
ncbi:BMP family ABC transporter substrate-binding protein [Pseudonocardia ailaonensis]|uniref:BMP family ABC transporter substrate-binding protein n=1 Tax=Pseudonocardia ailaonensis TaxID=367279 RepID=A0ABN2MK22_9PSEU